jgi:hypothetical protein
MNNKRKDLKFIKDDYLINNKAKDKTKNKDLNIDKYNIKEKLVKQKEVYIVHLKKLKNNNICLVLFKDFNMFCP